MIEAKYNSKKRTHEKIKKAFAELLAEKGSLNKISVAELSKRAEVTRGTFYAHFNNIFEVAEEIENEFISVLEDSTKHMKDEEDFHVYLHQVFVFLAENEELYRKLLQSDAPLIFITKLNTQINDVVHKLVEQSLIKRPTLDLDVMFMTDAATFMIIRYFRGKLDLSLDEIEWYLRQRVEEMFSDKQ